MVFKKEERGRKKNGKEKIKGEYSKNKNGNYPYLVSLFYMPYDGQKSQQKTGKNFKKVRGGKYFSLWP